MEGLIIQIKAAMGLTDEARGDLAVGIPRSYDLGADGRSVELNSG